MNVELMKMVRAQVLINYKHVHMDSWVENITKGRLKENAEEVKADPDDVRPLKAMACGTAGCIAGHTVILALPKKLLKLCDSTIQETATALLALSQYESEALFMFHFNGTRGYHKDNGDYIKIEPTIYEVERKALRTALPGTKKYAKIVARAIDKCIKRNS